MYIFLFHFELRSDPESDPIFFSAEPDPDPRIKNADPHPCGKLTQKSRGENNMKNWSVGEKIWLFVKINTNLREKRCKNEGKKENFTVPRGKISFLEKGGGQKYHNLGKYTPLKINLNHKNIKSMQVNILECWSDPDSYQNETDPQHWKVQWYHQQQHRWKDCREGLGSVPHSGGEITNL